MNKTTTLRFTIITWFVAVLFSACIKDPDVAVQQGKTTIQINAITAPE